MAVVSPEVQNQSSSGVASAYPRTPAMGQARPVLSESSSSLVVAQNETSRSLLAKSSSGWKVIWRQVPNPLS
jgi:hypothetical protein